VFKAVKVSSLIGINVRRGERGELWQDRFFDRALRTVKECNETVEYIHLNPERRGLVVSTGVKGSQIRHSLGSRGLRASSAKTR
jgi:hypothetical protein